VTQKEIVFEQGAKEIYAVISEQLPFDAIAEMEIIQTAVAQGYDLATLKEAWMPERLPGKGDSAFLSDRPAHIVTTFLLNLRLPASPLRIQQIQPVSL